MHGQTGASSAASFPKTSARGHHPPDACVLLQQPRFSSSVERLLSPVGGGPRPYKIHRFLRVLVTNSWSDDDDDDKQALFMHLVVSGAFANVSRSLTYLTIFQGSYQNTATIGRVWPRTLRLKRGEVFLKLRGFDFPSAPILSCSNPAQMLRVAKKEDYT